MSATTGPYSDSVSVMSTVDGPTSKRQRVTCSGRLACVLLSARPMGQKVSSGSAGLNFVRSYFIITSYESCLDTLTWLTYSLATNT
jgi:hypothetical protein